MEFKVRYSNTFVMNIFAIVVASLLAVMNFISPIIKHGPFHYLYIGWALIAVVRFLVYRRHIYRALRNEAILRIDETCIYDYVKNIKYDWTDIKEIYEENAYLYIILYNPADYLVNFHNPSNAFLQNAS